MTEIYKIYNILYKEYGPQGWWPFLNYKGSNKNKQGATEGYHILQYNFPRNEDEIFEVCLGSILTQNTTFTAVVKSLNNLNDKNCLNYKAIKNMDIDELKQAIKPSGYLNQKAKYIINFIEFFETLDNKIPTRDELLNIVGIGPETADSMLLYGYNQAQFKIDAYTRRIFSNINIIDEKIKYHDLKELFESELKKDIKNKEELRIVFQEYHALIVNHAKVHYSKKPYKKDLLLSKFS